MQSVNQNSSFLGRPFARVVTALGSFFNISFFHFIRLFWNHVFTCNGVSFNRRAKSFLPWVERYLSSLNLSSINFSCSCENTVLVLRKLRLSVKKERKYLGTGQRTGLDSVVADQRKERNQTKKVLIVWFYFFHLCRQFILRLRSEKKWRLVHWRENIHQCDTKIAASLETMLVCFRRGIAVGNVLGTVASPLKNRRSLGNNQHMTRWQAVEAGCQ